MAKRDIDLPENYAGMTPGMSSDQVWGRPAATPMAPTPPAPKAQAEEGEDEPNEPLDLGKGSDAPMETVAPPPIGKMGASLASNSDVKLRPDQIGSLDGDKPAAQSSGGSGGGSQIPTLTADDLAQSRDQQRSILRMGAIGDALANQNSFGNYFLGRMQPHQNVMGNAEAMANLAGQGVKDKLALQQQAMQAPDRQLIQDAMNKDSDYTKARQAELQGTLAILGKTGGMDPEKAQQLMQNVGNLNGFQAGKILESLKPVADIVRSQAMLGMAGRRLDQGDRNIQIKEDNQAASAGDKLDRDPRMLQYSGQRSQLQKGMSLLQSNQPITPQMASEEAANFASILSGAKGAGLEQTNKMEYNSALGNFARMKQFMLGHPQDALPPDLRSAMLESYQRLDGALGQQQASRAMEVMKGRHYSNPNAQRTMEDKVNSYQGGSAPSSGDGLPGVGSAVAGDTVSVISPEGKKGKIPSGSLKAALARGFKVVQ